MNSFDWFLEVFEALQFFCSFDFFDLFAVFSQIIYVFVHSAFIAEKNIEKNFRTGINKKWTFVTSWDLNVWKLAEIWVYQQYLRLWVQKI